MSKQEKGDHLKLFFNFILSEVDLKTCGSKPLEENQSNVGLRMETSIMKDELNPILHNEQQTTESLLSNDKNFQEWKKVSIVPSDLDIENVLRTTISAIFTEAKSLTPTRRNRDFLTCRCKNFVWYNFCVHSNAAACELNIWFDYFVVI